MNEIEANRSLFSDTNQKGVSRMLLLLLLLLLLWLIHSFAGDHSSN